MRNLRWTATLLAIAGSATAQTLADGQLLLESRLRYEHGKREDLGAGNALTWRTRLGYESPAWSGFSALFEGQWNAVADEDAFDPYPGAQGAAGKTVIADGKDLKVSRAGLQYKSSRAELTLGRQRLNLDNARFVGDVGWRQNGQFFDALAARAKPTPKVELLYAYLNRANRIFGRDAEQEAQRYFTMDSHIGHLSWQPRNDTTFVGYVYVLRVHNSRADSGSTFGVFSTGQRKRGAWTLGWRAEYAHQVDNDRSLRGVEFGLDLVALEGRAGHGRVTGTWGFESLGGDGSRGFGTPLATLHAFDGWADVFLTTPPDGLRDLYASGALNLPADFRFRAIGHRFGATRGGADYGWEVDLLLTRKLGPRLLALAKYAGYRGDAGGPASVRPDLDRFTIQLDFSLTSELRP